MRILFIAPLPPPATGQSIASYTVLKSIERDHDVFVVNFNKETFRQGISSFYRIVDVCRMLVRILTLVSHSDVIYLTISQSTAGVLKDTLIYLVCYHKLASIVLHSHGNGIRKLVFNRYPLLRIINSFFYRRISRLIILGPSHIPVFEGLIPASKLAVVYNFADDELFLSDDEINAKFANPSRVTNIVFVSNMLPGKGYSELLEAFSLLPVGIKSMLSLTFAGGFESDLDRENFLARCNSVPGASYCGIADKSRKLSLFKSAHIFCLPTCYPYEGQPISILEAYASGCAVVTTYHAGIPDIFKDNVNGLRVSSQSPLSIYAAILRLVQDPATCLQYALENARNARLNYKRLNFSQSVEAVINSACPRGHAMQIS
jgi:glycosyltransferase involved in cell wall biosynthesis